MSVPTTSASPNQAPVTRAVAVIDIGASAVRVVIAELAPGRRPVLLEEASRAVALGKDTFSSGRIGARTIDAALKALGGFKRLMDGYGVTTYRAVATSAVREASNADTFLDRVRVRTGIDVEVIDGAEESRLTYLAVRDCLGSHPAMQNGLALLVEIGGGSADLTLMDHGQPIQSGVYPLGAIRMRQSLGNWQGSHEQRIRLLTRHVLNVVGDIREEMPLASARHMVALGHDVRFAAGQLSEAGPDGVQQVERERFIDFCQRVEALDQDTIADRFRLAPVDAETLAPALLVSRSLLAATAAEWLTVPDVSLRAGLLVDLARPDDEPEFADFSRQVLTSAAALGEKYRYDAPHARQVARLAVRLFDELRDEHGLASRDRLLLEVAALLHDIGIFVSLRAHHKHSQYLLTAAEIFGLASEDQVLVGNVARYHRRGLPQRTHLPYMELDREDRVRVNKLSALLRIANALDAEHMQKITDVAVRREGEHWVLEVDGAGDLTMERLAATSRADLFAQVLGHDLVFRIKGPAS
jgi:exopolyphosphatase/guanosine-5'-triphosphate,3'-diphosphate pyrophosphatase